jgi:uncharacterized sulfatase
MHWTVYSAPASAQRPNILYVYVDDMGWGSIGPNGQAQRRADGKPSVRTPSIDRLAAEGINFTRGYGCHVCSPARSSQQSGFHQGHTFADRNDPNNARKAMRADDQLMGDCLSAAGYVTGYWGKWGYGGSQDLNNPVIENIQTLPTSHGYKHVLAELHHVRAHTFFQPTLWSAPASADAIGGIELVVNSMDRYRDRSEYPPTPAMQNLPNYPGIAYCDDSYAFAALDFVRSQGTHFNDTGQPFFGLLAVQIPHAPFGDITKLPQWDQAYTSDPHFASLSQQTRQWAAMVTRMDAHIGNLLAALEDPNNDGDSSDSIASQTLVIFQSDNGGPSGSNNIEFNANGDLRGTKGQIHEGGIRVPLVMRWPDKIRVDSALRAGADCDILVDVSDLLPTFCELAGASVPLGLDGVSIAPTLMGSGHQRHRDFLIHEAVNGQSIIRGKHKLIRSKKSPLRLYNLDADPSESNDIAPDHPELVKELETLLLGERVAEPAGFANTYHHWTGKDGDLADDPDHWSDYVYANKGITYISDNGAPQISWTARIENTGNQPSTALAAVDLEFLGLEIEGSQPEAPQSLELDTDVNLTGRNEVRIAAGGTLRVNGGKVSSLRWVNIQPSGAMVGTGSIDSTLYNNGTLQITGDQQPQLTVSKAYNQSAQGSLSIQLSGKEQLPALQIAGDAVIGGTLNVSIGDGFEPTPSHSYRVLSAKNIEGKFANVNDEFVASDGSRFTIHYHAQTVSLTVRQ